MKMSSKFDNIYNAEDYLLESDDPNDRKESGSKWPSFNLYGSAVLVSIGASFCFGYECLIINPAKDAFTNFVNSTYAGAGNSLNEDELNSKWGFIVSMFFWGCTLGSVLISKILDIFGRKNGLVFTFTVQAMSVGLAILSYFAHSSFLYTASRFILGAALAASLGIAPVFVTECSPAACRGVTSLTIGILFQCGTVVGAIVAMPQLLGTTTSWWIMHLIELVIIIIVITITLFTKETPGYLLSHDEPDAAVKSIQFYYKLNEADAIKERVEMEKTINNEPSFGLFAVFKDPTSRYGTLVGTTVMVCMVMSGIAAINAFAYEICLSVGLNPLAASIGNVIICFVTVVGFLFSNVLIGRFGRRPLLLIGFSTLVVFNICLPLCMYSFAASKVNLVGWLVVLFICVYNFIISTGVIPIAFFITGELVNQKGRGAACTWANFMFNLSRSLMLLVYYPLKTALGDSLSYFILFFPPVALAVVVVYFCLPETKGKNPEQTKEEIQKLPGRKHKKNKKGNRNVSKDQNKKKTTTTRSASKTKATTGASTEQGSTEMSVNEPIKKKTVSSELGRSRDNVARSREASKAASVSREPGNTLLNTVKDGTPEGSRGSNPPSKESDEKIKNSKEAKSNEAKNEAQEGSNDVRSENKPE